MSDIYGDLAERPEVPTQNAGRFTVQIKFHEFEPRRVKGPNAKINAQFCDRCGFNRVSPVHPKESK